MASTTFLRPEDDLHTREMFVREHVTKHEWPGDGQCTNGRMSGEQRKMSNACRTSPSRLRGRCYMTGGCPFLRVASTTFLRPGDNFHTREMFVREHVMKHEWPGRTVHERPHIGRTTGNKRRLYDQSQPFAWAMLHDRGAVHAYDSSIVRRVPGGSLSVLCTHDARRVALCHRGNVDVRRAMPRGSRMILYFRVVAAELYCMDRVSGNVNTVWSLKTTNKLRALKLDSKCSTTQKPLLSELI